VDAAADGTVKMAIFVIPRFRRNVLMRFGFGRWAHEVHEDFGEICGKHCGGLEKRGGVRLGMINDE